MTTTTKAVSAAIISLACILPAAAQDEAEEASLTGYVTFASDYRFRGHSQTDRSGAIQGGIDFAHPSGFFAGVWASTIDFNDPQESPAEVDFTAGYAHTFAADVEASVALAYYWYPESDPAEYDYVEVLATVSRDFGGYTLSGEMTISPEYSGETGLGIGVALGLAVPVTVGEVDWLTASGQIGRQWIEDNGLYGSPDWLFYQVGLTATWRMFALDLQYVGTDVDTADCFGGTDLCEAGVVVSLTATFPG